MFTCDGCGAEHLSEGDVFECGDEDCWAIICDSCSSDSRHCDDCSSIEPEGSQVSIDPNQK